MIWQSCEAWNHLLKPILYKIVLSNDLNNKYLGDGIKGIPAVKFLIKKLQNQYPENLLPKKNRNYKLHADFSLFLSAVLSIQ